METWFLLNSELGDPAWNMALDEALLESVAALGHPVLRFYGWNEPAATFGYFQKFREVAGWTSLRPLIRRPTGGGLVPHDKDWTYSLAFPPGHWWYELRAEESYRRVHEWISAAFHELRLQTNLAPCCAKEGPGQCFVGAEKFDLLFQGQKIAGAAQRRNKHGLLIQGSVQLHPDHISRDEWEEAMTKVASKLHQIKWAELKLSEQISYRTKSLQVEKFSRPEFNARR